jgi:hypothetical protein
MSNATPQAQPDRILDIRVSVPSNAVGKYVVLVGDRVVDIEAINPAIDREAEPEPIDREAIQLDAIQAQLTDLFRQVRNIRGCTQGTQERIDNIEKHCETMQAAIEMMPSLDERINDVNQRAARETMAKIGSEPS